ncbi:MAG: class I SAM-dependent methyltransferase [Oscillospiraceae bacterium]|jgi:23S rRNA (cytosine1962-C5)-methyltransferase|nr:class I SAM-dependent methyltransferase [Oscillospiraceae bacterium]
MRYSKDWQEYELIDCSGGERLERWGEVILIRPDPQILWETTKEHPLWKDAHARYIRSKSGGGSWETYKKIPDSWRISFKHLSFNLKPMGFKHTGLFPEQAVNWEFIHSKIGEAVKGGRAVRVLNLFAYTGGATLAALAAGAEVCHVDASKGMTSWARENAAASSLNEKPVRWIVDDCLKFVAREIRRGSFYDVVIMDPPSYGRGPNGEIWKLEEQIYKLIELCSRVLTENPLCFIVNSYTTGLSPSVMNYMNGVLLCKKYGGRVWADEIGIPVSLNGLVLPCGATAVWEG